MTFSKVLFLKISIFLIVYSSCQKVDNSTEINALKESVTALQKRSDSLSNALANTNTNVASLSKSIDSIKSQLAAIVTQLSTLNAQLIQINANIQSITSQITLLNQQYADLLAKLNSILAQLAVSPTSLSNGLVAYYPFTGNAGDSSGNGNNGVVNSGVVLSTDRYGTTNSAYSFIGGTIVISHKSYLSIPQVGQFSLSIWVNKTGTQNPVHIIGKRAQSAQSFNWLLGQHTTPAGAVGGGLVFTGATPSTSVGVTATGIDYNGLKDSVIQVNKWEHLVGVYDNGNWYLYKNGVLAAQKNTGIYAPDNGTPPLEIGNCGGWGAFYGKIDDVRIYSRVLSADEIKYLASH